MKLKISLVILALSCISAIAQQKVTGIVTDTHKNPLIGVEVYIEELQKGTSTDENGYYEISNLPNHQIKLTANYLGFKTATKTINLVEQNNTINFVLEEAIFTMGEIIISTPFNKLQSENVMKVDKASAALLKSKGATNLIEGVSLIPGVSQVSTGMGIGKPVIRGLRGNRVLVYSQGIRLENQQFGDEHGLGVDESSIESVEVIKGPASLLYGSDALGGVIYFNPLKFAEGNSFKLNIGQQYLSNTNGSSTTAGFKKSFNAWKFLANGAVNSHSDYKTPKDGRVTNTRFKEANFNAGIGFDNAINSSTLRFGFNQTSVGIPEEIGAQNDHKSPLLPYQQLSTKMVSLNSIFFLNNSKITTVFGYTINDRKEFEEHHDEHEHDEDEHDEDEHDEDKHDEDEHDEDEHDEDMELHPSLHLKLETFSYDIKYEFPSIKNYESIIGVQGLYQENSNYGEEILIPNATTNDFGILYTGTWSWNSFNSFQAGIRYDIRSIETEKHEIAHEDEIHIFEPIDKNFQNFSASLGYKTKLFKAITTRINVASGFKAPNLAELTSNGVHHGSNRFEIGNADLNSEQNIQLDISLDYSSKHIEIFGNGFYNHINDYIFISPTGEFEEETPVFQYIQDNAKLYGGEFGFHLHPHPLDWLHLQSNYEIVIGKQDNGDYLPLIPAQKFINTIRSEFNIKDWLQKGFAAITVESNFSQNKVGQFETASKGYNLVNFGLGATLKANKTDFDLSLNLNNAFNKSYISHLSRLKSNNISNIGRNFLASVKFKF